MSEKKLNGTVIVTYRCNARCTCAIDINVHQNQRKK